MLTWSWDLRNTLDTRNSLTLIMHVSTITSNYLLKVSGFMAADGLQNPWFSFNPSNNLLAQYCPLLVLAEFPLHFSYFLFRVWKPSTLNWFEKNQGLISFLVPRFLIDPPVLVCAQAQPVQKKHIPGFSSFFPVPSRFWQFFPVFFFQFSGQICAQARTYVQIPDPETAVYVVRARGPSFVYILYVCVYVYSKYLGERLGVPWKT